MSKVPERIIDIDGIRVFEHAPEVLFILNEIFVEGAYNIHFDYPVVVWDIGMNRGLASLYFARMPQVLAVVGCEPFRPTFDQACQNFLLNPTLSEKIIPSNIGIGSESRNLRIDYAPQWTGNMRTDGLPGWLADDPTVAVQQEDVVIRSAREVLDRIMAACPGAAIVAKIDCEGAEYEIVGHLADLGRLASIKVIMVEWHLRGPEELVDLLKQAGFTVFLGHTLPDRGMIWAVR